MRARKNETTQKKIEIGFKDWRRCKHKRVVYYLRESSSILYEYWTCIDCGLDVKKEISEN
jgi:hypothetical protein